MQVASKYAHRRVGWTTAVAAMTALLLSSCGSPGTDSPSTSSGTGDSTNTASGTVTVWVGSWWSDNIPKIESAWTQDHPEITLKIEPQPIDGYPDKFTASAIGGTPPDIIDLDAGMFPTIAAKGLLQPLDDFVGSNGIKSSDYASAIWDASRYQGTQYGVPDHAFASVAYYNKTVFDNAGVAYPTDSWTYDDLLEISKQLTIPGQYGIGMAADLSDPANAMDFLAQCIWGHGGEFFNQDYTEATINSPEAVAGIAYWAEFLTKYQVAPPGTPNFTSTRDVLPLFEANQVGIITYGAGALSEFANYPDLKYGTVQLPTGINLGGGWTMGIPVGAANPAGAQVFLKWFADAGRQAEFMPTAPGLIAANQLPPWNGEQFAIFTEAMSKSRSLPAVGAWTEMQTGIITEAQKLLTGQETPQQAADSMASMMNSKL